MSPAAVAWMASMRPRRFRRGKPSLHVFVANRRRGFNEAPAIPPGKTGAAARVRNERRPASMRPRRFRRGKPFTFGRPTMPAKELQ